MYKSVGKVLLDRMFALLALFVLLPLFAIVAVSIKLESPGAVFFAQQRVGKYKQLFTIYKFRTMTEDPARVISQTVASSPGVTQTGRWLRRLKIDELPQLINVLLGDMSIVGPRPCLESHIISMSDEEQVRFTVLPGLTGLAQVNGNIALSWPERRLFDTRYARNISLSLDMKIILKTFLVIIFGEDRFKRNKPCE